MLFPIRCITCNKVINQYYNLYTHMVNENKQTPKDVLDKLKIVRYCCRRMFLCHVDMFDYISDFDKSNFPFIHDNIKNIRHVDNIVQIPVEQSNVLDEDGNVIDIEIEVDVDVDADVDLDEFNGNDNIDIEQTYDGNYEYDNDYD